MLELIPNQLGYPLLSLLIFIPVVGSFILLFIRNAATVRWIALGVAAIDLALCVPLLTGFDTTTANMQFGESLPWIAAWGINYKLGVDGIVSNDPRLFEHIAAAEAEADAAAA